MSGMKGRSFFAALIASTIVVLPSAGVRAEIQAPAHYLRERGVTRVAGSSVQVPDLSQKRMTVDFFPDVSFTIVLQDVQTTNNTVTWFGKVEDAPHSAATFVRTAAGLVASVTTGDGKVYQLRTAENGAQWSIEIDQSKFPDESDPISPTPPPAASIQSNAVTAGDDGSTIDVMVLYTPAARQANGGTVGMQQLIQLGIAETNQGYVNSGVIPRVRLVQMQEVNYTEAATISTDLQRMRNLADGFLDDIDTLRTTYGADLVSLWVSTSEAVCGIGYELQDVTQPAAFLATLGFSVTEAHCATGNYTFGHEMGHNMGTHHARDDLDSNGSVPRGAYPYAFGYKQTTGTKFRTIMAYDQNCACPRINYWSNPDVSFAGSPTGIDPNSTQSAANYLVINNTRTIVANYRASVGTSSGTDILSPLLTITSHVNGQTVPPTSFVIVGTATDAGQGDSGISSVTINGVRASGDTATGAGTANWSRTLSLSSGANTLTIIATDDSPAHNTTVMTIVLFSGSPVSVTSNTYHIFPQFADGRFGDGTSYRTTLMISNPSASAGVNCTLQLRGFTVPGFTLNYAMGAGGWVISPTSGTQSFQSGYATLQCSAAVEAQLLYSYYDAFGVKISEATVFSSPPASIVKVLADEREGAQLGIAIANDSDQTTTYTITASGASGPGSLTLQPRTATAKFLRDLVPGIPANNVAQVLVSATNGTSSIIGLRYTGGVFTTIPESIRSAVGPTALPYHIFPQFADGRLADGTFYRTTRMYVNPSTTTTGDCTTRLRGMTTNGINQFLATIGPTGAIISPTTGTQTFQSGYATLRCSTNVEGQVLYSFYAPNGVKLSEATVFSSPAAQRVQILADMRGGSRVGIAIANDGDQTTTYDISIGDANGNIVGNTTQTLPGRSSTAKFLDEMIGLPPDYYGQVVVSSSTGIASIIGLRYTGAVFTTIPETIR